MNTFMFIFIIGILLVLRSGRIKICLVQQYNVFMFLVISFIVVRYIYWTSKVYFCICACMLFFNYLNLQASFVTIFHSRLWSLLQWPWELNTLKSEKSPPLRNEFGSLLLHLDVWCSLCRLNVQSLPTQESCFHIWLLESLTKFSLETNHCPSWNSHKCAVETWVWTDHQKANPPTINRTPRLREFLFWSFWEIIDIMSLSAFFCSAASGHRLIDQIIQRHFHN